jgi:putative acetyltransferase
MSVIITAERPDTAEATTLITELEARLETLYPRIRRSGMSVDQLLAAQVAFFVLRSNGAPAGCGGVQLVGGEYGEIKRLYVRPRFRGRGFGVLLLNHLAGYARERRVDLLRLESGIHQHDAIGLYEPMGFRRIPPFGAYEDHPLRLFFEKHLA